MKQKLTELKGEMGKHIIIAKDFYILLSTTNRSIRQKTARTQKNLKTPTISN